jgi:hypothetical protein
MAREKQLAPTGVISFLADGTASGLVTVPSTMFFKTKAQVVLTALGKPNLTLEVKEVVSENHLYVGIAGNIAQRHDISQYTVALNAKIEQPAQPRPNPSKDDRERATYEEEPTLARRNILVDWLGRYYTVDNPIPVRLSDGQINIGSVNAELEVQLSRKDNWPNVGDVHDSVRIGNQDYELAINPNGSINANIGGLSSPTVLNIPMPTSSNFYSFTLPLPCIKYMFQVRDGAAKLKYNFDNNPSSYFTAPMGNSVQQDMLKLNSPLTVYVQGSKNNLILEVIYWE